MTFTLSAIERSLQLLELSTMPARTKIVIAANLSAASKILQHDHFQAIRCDFFVRSQLESHLHNLQMINDGSQNGEDILGAVADSCTLLLFLGVTSPAGHTVTSSS